MTATFGIHLGNSSACIAIEKDGKLSVLANEAGERVTQAILSLQRNEWIVGKTANKSFVTDNKKIMSEDDDDDEELQLDFVKYTLRDEDNEEIITPDQVCTSFLAKMNKIAKHAANNEAEVNAVLAAPLHWSEDAVQRLRNAAERAGLKVLHVISEPAAACMAYKLDSLDQPRDTYACLIFRLGGTSSDLSVMNVSKGLFHVVESRHLPDLGGKAFTMKLVDFVADEFRHRWKLDPRQSKRSMAKLYQHADNCKRILSTVESSQIFIESLNEGVDWSQNVTRARFENLIAPEINRCLDAIKKLLGDCPSNLKIDKVILCGGTTKIPKLQNAISSTLPGVQILEGISPDEVIAVGCATQAALVNALMGFPIADISTSLECLKTSFHVKYLESDVLLFPEGSPLIVDTFLEIKNAEPLSALDFSLYDVSEPDCILGTFHLENLPKDCTIYASLENGEVSMIVA